MTTKLEQAARQIIVDWDSGIHLYEAITALREALAEQAEHEPVAWMNELNGFICKEKTRGYHVPLYSAPVRTKDLTDDEVWCVYQGIWPFHPAEEPKLADDIARFARAVIAADREKNK